MLRAVPLSEAQRRAWSLEVRRLQQRYALTDVPGEFQDELRTLWDEASLCHAEGGGFPFVGAPLFRGRVQPDPYVPDLCTDLSTDSQIGRGGRMLPIACLSSRCVLAHAQYGPTLPMMAVLAIC